MTVIERGGARPRVSKNILTPPSGYVKLLPEALPPQCMLSARKSSMHI